MSTLRAIAVIPARYAATRFPGKLLQTLEGRSILRHVMERAGRVPGLEGVVVATDDERIAEEVRRHGGEVRMTSPEHPSGTDRIGEALRGMADPPDLVRNLQGDEPRLDPDAVGRLLEDLRRDPSSIWTLASPVADPEEFRRPSVVKVARTADGRALYFSRAPIPYARDAGGGLPVGEAALRHIGVYGYPRALLERFLALAPGRLERLEGLEQLRALEAGMTIRVRIEAWPDAGVDTPEDLERLRATTGG